MKKIVLATMAAFCCTSVLRAQQQDDNVMSIEFTGENAPQEKLHGLEGAKITFSEDGEKMNLTVHEKTVTYDLSNVSGMTHNYVESPTVSISTHVDPNQAGTYYTTFYSSLEAYTIPEGVSAFTASNVENKSVSLAPIEGSVIPQGEPVLLQAASGTIELPLITSAASPSAGNAFKGVDVQTNLTTDKEFYVLSYGNIGVGFYKIGDSWTLSANKAFITLPAATSQMLTRGLNLSFPGGGTTGIESLEDTDSNSITQIYNLSGQRIDQPEKALYIVNGKKVYIK